jgi:hypothetical protein
LDKRKVGLQILSSAFLHRRSPSAALLPQLIPVPLRDLDLVLPARTASLSTSLARESASDGGELPSERSDGRIGEGEGREGLQESLQT